MESSSEIKMCLQYSEIKSQQIVLYFVTSLGDDDKQALVMAA